MIRQRALLGPVGEPRGKGSRLVEGREELRSGEPAPRRVRTVGLGPGTNPLAEGKREVARREVARRVDLGGPFEPRGAEQEERCPQVEWGDAFRATEHQPPLDRCGPTTFEQIEQGGQPTGPGTAGVHAAFAGERDPQPLPLGTEQERVGAEIACYDADAFGADAALEQLEHLPAHFTDLGPYAEGGEAASPRRDRPLSARVRRPFERCRAEETLTEVPSERMVGKVGEGPGHCAREIEVDPCRRAGEQRRQEVGGHPGGIGEAVHQDGACRERRRASLEEQFPGGAIEIGDAAEAEPPLLEQGLGRGAHQGPAPLAGSVSRRPGGERLVEGGSQLGLEAGVEQVAHRESRRVDPVLEIAERPGQRALAGRSPAEQQVGERCAARFAPSGQLHDPAGGAVQRDDFHPDDRAEAVGEAGEQVAPEAARGDDDHHRGRVRGDIDQRAGQCRLKVGEECLLAGAWARRSHHPRGGESSGAHGASSPRSGSRIRFPSATAGASCPERHGPCERRCGGTEPVRCSSAGARCGSGDRCMTRPTRSDGTTQRETPAAPRAKRATAAQPRSRGPGWSRQPPSPGSSSREGLEAGFARRASRRSRSAGLSCGSVSQVTTRNGPPGPERTGRASIQSGGGGSACRSAVRWGRRRSSGTTSPRAGGRRLRPIPHRIGCRAPGPGERRGSRHRSARTVPGCPRGERARP